MTDSRWFNWPTPWLCCCAMLLRFATSVMGAELESTECRLQVVPDHPLARDRHTTLWASFDAVDHNNAEYARTHTEDIGVGSVAD